MDLDSSSSSEDEIIANAVALDVETATDQQAESGWRVGIYGKKRNIYRGQCSWWDDYLAPQPRYTPSQFRRRSRIPSKLFRKLATDLPQNFPELQQKSDAIGRHGATIWQKILVSLRRLGDGTSYESLDDQARMSCESIRRAFKAFCHAVRSYYGSEFLNRPSSLSELRNIEQNFASKSFPGCIGSADCMTVKWKSCPKAWKGQYHNPRHGKLATIAVEAICDSNLYCWRMFAGRPAKNNDLTVAKSSPLFVSIFNGHRTMKFPEGCVLDGETRHWHLYFLVDEFTHLGLSS